MFVVSFAFRALSRDPSGDRVIPRAEVRVRAQTSHGNIIVLSHFKGVLLTMNKSTRNFRDLTFV